MTTSRSTIPTTAATTTSSPPIKSARQTSMDYAKMIEEAETRLEDLKQMKEYLYRIEEAICAIEKETSDVDNSLPTDEEIRRMKEGEAKRQILKLIDLDNTTFDIIDEILGPPTEDEDILKGIPTSACAS